MIKGIRIEYEYGCRYDYPEPGNVNSNKSV